MTLLLTNKDVRGLLDMPTLIEAMRRAFQELGRGDAAAVGRVDVLSPGKDDSVHGFKTMTGVSLGYAVARIDSDLLRWPVRGGGARREKLRPEEARIGKENGLLFLYSTSTGELLGIHQDGEIQRLRVGATSALALQLLGPPAEVVRHVGFLGSGYQAEAQLAALLAVYHPETVCMFSPRPERRRSFVERMRQLVGPSDVELVEADSAAGAADGAQVLVCATNSMAPVVDADWLRPGMHVNCIKKPEISEAVLRRCDRVGIATHMGTRTVLAGVSRELIGAEDNADAWWKHPPFVWDTLPDLPTMLAHPEQHTRQHADEVTAYIGLGSGVQFAAACGMAHEVALSAGVGRTLPDEWFLQDVPQE
ncbi:MAG: hypothetical protein GEU81_08495 [Nitriliruptorales bacterium]|nr:hypothetical protein [Nitriliruptorales bacterium]